MISVNFEAMKKKIEDILDEGRYNGLPTHIVAEQLLNLHTVIQQRELLKSFADEAQEKMYDQPDNDLSDFIDDFLKDFYSC